MRKIGIRRTHWYLMVEARSSAQFSTAGGAQPVGMSLPAELMPEMNRVVRGLAGQLHARLPHGCGIELSDLVQAGNVGLLQAARSFEPANGAPLGGYARFRIRGEMLDMVRRNAARPQAALSRDFDNTGVDAVAEIPAAPEHSPHVSVASRQRAAILDEELGRLPARHRAVVRLRYGREMTLREIGVRLQVNESRACQIHQSALLRLRKALSVRGVREMAHL